MDLNKATLVAGMLASYVLRGYLLVLQRGMANRREGVGGRLVPPFLLVCFHVLPLGWILIGWPSIADHAPVAWTWLVGIPLFSLIIWLMARAHLDLGRNWSTGVAVSGEHTLVTQGIYARFRHPIYAAHWLWAIAQGLLVANWVAGMSGLVAILVERIWRVPAEERQLEERFGQAYRDYRARVGGILPIRKGMT